MFSSLAAVRWQDSWMVLMNTWSFGLMLWSCGLGKVTSGVFPLFAPLCLFWGFFPFLSLSHSLKTWSGRHHLWFSCPLLFVGGLSQQDSSTQQAEGGTCYLAQMLKRSFAIIHAFLHEHEGWKVWFFDRRVDWFLTHGIKLVSQLFLMCIFTLLEIPFVIPSILEIKRMFAFSSNVNLL